MNNSHEFSIFLDLNFVENQIFEISQDKIYHRIVRVLRLNINENLVLFNKNFHYSCKILEISKRSIKIIILKKIVNIELKPSITLCISLLKKEAFQEAIYYACEFGANIIQPVWSKKAQSKWQDKDRERLENIIISAAEQSKNYNFPTLKSPISLNDLIAESKNIGNKLFFDSKGEELMPFIKDRESKKTSEILIFFGPEADLDPEEKLLIKNAGFNFYRLTSTILRAQSAVQLGLGILRALI